MGWSQIFLNIEFASAGKIKGESEFSGFEGQIVLLDFDWSMAVNQDVRLAGGAIKRKVSVEPLKLTKRFDSASVSLLKAMAQRDPITKARISVAHRIDDAVGSLRQAFAIEVEKARLESVKLDMSDEGNSTILKEDLLIRYSKIKVEYFPIGQDGKYGTRAKTYMSQFQDVINLHA